MSGALGRILRFIVGGLLCALGGIGGIGLIVIAIQSTGAWAFALIPLAIILGIILLTIGSKLIARGLDG